MKLGKETVEGFIQFLEDFCIVHFFGEKVDQSRRSGTTVQEFKELLAWTQILNI